MPYPSSFHTGTASGVQTFINTDDFCASKQFSTGPREAADGVPHVLSYSSHWLNLRSISKTRSGTGEALCGCERYREVSRNTQQ